MNTLPFHQGDIVKATFVNGAGTSVVYMLIDEHDGNGWYDVYDMEKWARVTWRILPEQVAANIYQQVA